MTSESNIEYSLNWKDHMAHVRKAFSHLLNSNELTDVTLCCEGKKIGAHKILLSACSNYFRDILKEVPCHHPVIILYGVEYSILLDILHFIYNGEVEVNLSKLESFSKVAQLLQISGLTYDNEKFGTGNGQAGDTDSEQETEEMFLPLTHTSVESLDVSKNDASKRSNQVDISQDKEKRQDRNKRFTSAVNCEPTELVTLEDPLEQPLLQADAPSDAIGHNAGGEEFKTGTATKASHFEESSRKCAVCDKIFAHPDSLLHHMAMHSGKTQCPICKVVLARKYNLKMHMKAVHNIDSV